MEDFGNGVAVVSDNSSDVVCEDPVDGPASALSLIDARGRMGHTLLWHWLFTICSKSKF